MSDDSEEIIRSRMVVHLKPFDGFVILDDWIERPFLKFLPVPAKIVLGVRIEQKQEVFNIGDDLL